MTKFTKSLIFIMGVLFLFSCNQKKTENAKESLSTNDIVKLNAVKYFNFTDSTESTKGDILEITLLDSFTIAQNIALSRLQINDGINHFTDKIKIEKCKSLLSKLDSIESALDANVNKIVNYKYKYKVIHSPQQTKTKNGESIEINTENSEDSLFFYTYANPNRQIVSTTDEIENKIFDLAVNSEYYLKNVRNILKESYYNIIDEHRQIFNNSCIPSGIEMVLKLNEKADCDFYDYQKKWKNKSDGNFSDFDGLTKMGLRFYHKFNLDRNDKFPLNDLFMTIDQELAKKHYVLVSLASPSGWHMYVICTKIANGEFVAYSKIHSQTIVANNVKEIITQMKGTDIMIYQEN